MSAFGSKLRRLEGGMVLFHCPGCKTGHQVRVDPAFGSAWGFNGNGDAPTFTPSVLVRSGHHAPGHSGSCWCDAKDKNGESYGFACVCCHSFITDGMIQFLGDCTHALAGQKVPLPDHPGNRT